MTAPQRALLRRFAAGETMHRCSHTNVNTPDSFFFSGEVGKNQRRVTVEALLKLGFIEDFEDPGWRWRGSRYRITDAGRVESEQEKTK